MAKEERNDVSASGPKYMQAFASLPEELRPIFKAMVEEYRFYALKRYGRAWVAYDVTADLVKAGWRSSEEEL